MSTATESYARNLTHTDDGYKLTRTDGHMLLLVASHYNEREGYAWPSVATLAREAKMCRRYAQIVLRRLAKHAVLEIRPAARDNAGQTSNRYFFPALSKVRPPLELQSAPPPDPQRSRPLDPADRPISREQQLSAPSPAHDGDGDAEKAVTLYEQLVGHRAGGSMRLAIAKLLYAGAPLEWFAAACESAVGARAPWPYVRSLLEHWRADGFGCECRRVISGVEGLRKSQNDGDDDDAELLSIEEITARRAAAVPPGPGVVYLS